MISKGVGLIRKCFLAQVDSGECFRFKRAEKFGLWRKKKNTGQKLKIKSEETGKLPTFPEAERQER